MFGYYEQPEKIHFPEMLAQSMASNLINLDAVQMKCFCQVMIASSIVAMC